MKRKYHRREKQERQVLQGEYYHSKSELRDQADREEARRGHREVFMGDKGYTTF